MYKFTCTPRVITSYLLSIIGILLTANFFVIHRRIVAPDPNLKGFRAAFYFGTEANFPGLFTALLILACGMIFWKVANLAGTSDTSRRFRLLSAFYLVLAFNDFFNIHLQLIQVVNGFVFSAFHYSINTILLTAFIILLFISTLLTGISTLPAKLKLRTLIAFFTYLAGSALKMFLYPTQSLQPDLTDVFSAFGQTAGQLLEMTAMLYLLHGLMQFYLSNIERADIRLIFFPSQPGVEHEKLEDLSLK
jgi:hypothetical protein